MRFSFTAEQDEFRATLRRAFAARSPTTEVRRLMATEAGYERDAWDRLNSELGLTAVAIPEAYGGAGFGAGELCIVLEEMGRSLLCAPYFATAAMAATVIQKAGTEAEKRELLPMLASGKSTATLAYTGAGPSLEAVGAGVVATRSGTGWRLSGAVSPVLDGLTADLLVVAASGAVGAGLSLFTIQGKPAGLTRQPLRTMDETRKFARLVLDRVEARPLGEIGGAGEAVAATLRELYAYLANEMVGGAERLREDALAYVKMRMQFGRSIASFQATKHKAADMLVDVELAKSAAYCAAAAIDEADPEAPALASLAKAAACDAYLQTAIHAVQMHGGIGFTWDNDTHLWFKRAKSSEVLFGDANAHRELLVRQWKA